MFLFEKIFVLKLFKTNTCVNRIRNFDEKSELTDQKFWFSHQNFWFLIKISDFWWKLLISYQFFVILIYFYLIKSLFSHQNFWFLMKVSDFSSIFCDSDVRLSDFSSKFLISDQNSVILIKLRRIKSLISYQIFWFLIKAPRFWYFLTKCLISDQNF